MTNQMARLPGWEVALVDVLLLHQDRPLAYGTSDCIVMIADAEKAMTGVDRMAGLRGTYDSEAGARRVLKARGYRSVADLLSHTFEECPPAMARRGDCGLVRVPHGKRHVLAAVLVLGAMVAGKAPQGGGSGPDSGRVLLPRSRLVKAFRIG